MEVWVAGATGVLARHAIPQLMEAGHTLVGLARSRNKWPDIPATVRFIACDVTSEEQVPNAFDGARPDAILHLATAIPTGRPTARDWERNDAIRRHGTRHLLAAALASGAYYVQQSVHYLAVPQGDAWIDESSPAAGKGIMASAADAERLAQQAFQQGLEGCILRNCMFYGKNNPQTTPLLDALRSGVPMLVGGGRNYWSFLHPSDAASALVHVLERRPVGAAFYVGDDEPVTMADGLRWLAAKIGANPPKTVSPFLAKVALGGDTVDLLTGSRRVSNARAREALGWRPRYPSFRDGLSAELTPANG